jgi:hypothetical protein
VYRADEPIEEGQEYTGPEYAGPNFIKKFIDLSVEF